MIKQEHISEDPFFDNPKNIEAIEKGIKEVKEGDFTKLDPNKTLWENII